MGPDAPPTSLFLTIGGRVQGVGFRPFVYRLATRLGLDGEVRNCGGEVEIRISGPPVVLTAFRRDLIETAPPFARPVLLSERPAEPASAGFRILPSGQEARPRVHLPPDQACCDECLTELSDPAERRYRYPFINCTQCGPRYTLIAALPYDRPNTAMAGFPLCPECRREYEDPADRRYHAEPTACPVCGPQLWFAQPGQAAVIDNEAALALALSNLRSGNVVAVKGVGGYHLLCDARDTAAVARLRTRKPRPDKPLAVLFPQRGQDGLDAVRADLMPGAAEAAGLTAPERPIVLCARRPNSTLAANLAPGLNEVGAMLPYSPLHHLLLEDFNGPLVATSGNIGGDPVTIDAAMAEVRLGRVADAFLHHDRPIVRPADDAVLRVIAGHARPLRLGRGTAPLELTLPIPLPEPVLAVGGHMKNSIALAWDDRVVVSPHIGDLQSPRSRAAFEQVIADLQRLYGITARRVLCDAHPGYASSRWAARSGLPVTPVFHHHAHASALYTERTGRGDWLVFTWDGVGYGEDRTLWGGEALLGRPGQWRRVARLRPFRLPGGERAGREPWRAAAALCWESGRHWLELPTEAAPLHTAWRNGINSPATSAAGRLFDAATALLGLVQQASFEGQGPMQLEAIADPNAAPVVLPVEGEQLLEIDWEPLLGVLLDAGRTAGERAGSLHASLAAAIAEVTARISARATIEAVGLTGGVFQNRLLTELAMQQLAEAGRTVALAEAVPCNDAGLAYGQVGDYLGRLNGAF